MEYGGGQTEKVTLHDASVIYLYKEAEHEQVTDRCLAMEALEHHKKRGRILTGILYIDPEGNDTHEILHTSKRPLNAMDEQDLCPGNDVLSAINDRFR